jgi:hypothetical protein
LELLFEVNEYFEECMPDNAKIKSQKNPQENKLLNFLLKHISETRTSFSTSLSYSQLP